MKLAGVDVPAVLANAVGGDAPACVLVRNTRGTPTTGALTNGTNPTSVSYACRGYSTVVKDEIPEGQLVRERDRVVAIYAHTLRDGAGALVVPRAGDRLTITEDGLPSVEFAIIGIIGRGTAAGRYLLHGRM